MVLYGIELYCIKWYCIALNPLVSNRIVCHHNPASLASPLLDDIVVARVVARVVPIVREGKEVREVWETRQRKQS